MFPVGQREYKSRALIQISNGGESESMKFQQREPTFFSRDFYPKPLNGI